MYCIYIQIYPYTCICDDVYRYGYLYTTPYTWNTYPSLGKIDTPPFYFFTQYSILANMDMDFVDTITAVTAEEYIGVNPIVLRARGILVARASDGTMYTFDDNAGTATLLSMGRLGRRSGRTNPYGCIKGIPLHKLIGPPGRFHEHVNGDVTDNRRANIIWVRGKMDHKPHKNPHPGVYVRNGYIEVHWYDDRNNQRGKSFSLRNHDWSYAKAIDAATDFIETVKKGIRRYQETEIKMADHPAPNLAKMDLRFLLCPLSSSFSFSEE
jgi:hypothetical protein